MISVVRLVLDISILSPDRLARLCVQSHDVLDVVSVEGNKQRTVMKDRRSARPAPVVTGEVATLPDDAAIGSYTLVVSNGETSVSSDPVSVAPPYVALFAGLTLNGQSGDVFRVEYRDAVDPTSPWRLLERRTLQQETEVVYDPGSSEHTYRFYRAIQE